MKLTKEHRADVIAACIKATFSARDAAYMASRTALADAMYQHAFGDVEKLVNKLPDGWTNDTGTVSITHPEFSRRHYSDEEKCPENLKLSKWRRVPINIGTAFKVGTDHPLNDQAQAVADEYQSLRAAQTVLRNSLTGMLASCTTLAKLKELWPEGEKFHPVEVVKQNLPVPYELAANVNKIMGIKPAKKGA